MNHNFFEHEQTLNLKNRKQDFDEALGTHLHNHVAWLQECRCLIDEAAFYVAQMESSRGYENHPDFLKMKKLNDDGFSGLKRKLDVMGALAGHRDPNGPNGWRKPTDLSRLDYSKKFKTKKGKDD